MSLKNNSNKKDFLGGPVVKNPPAHVENIVGSYLWSRKIPHAEEQLSPGTTTAEPMHLDLAHCNE